MIDGAPCPDRARDWPSADRTSYEDMVAFFAIMFPHTVEIPVGLVGQWRADNPLFAWLAEQVGECAMGHVWGEDRTLTIHWTRGTWVFNSVNAFTQFRFQNADQAFAFKMRWG